MASIGAHLGRYEVVRQASFMLTVRSLEMVLHANLAEQFLREGR